jgi:ABC-type amino acid transport substrate-binding protein
MFVSLVLAAAAVTDLQDNHGLIQSTIDRLCDLSAQHRVAVHDVAERKLVSTDWNIGYVVAAPFIQQAAGNTSGYLWDLINRVESLASDAGSFTYIQAASQDEGIAGVEAGVYDVLLLGASINNRSLAGVDFSSPYQFSGVVSLRYTLARGRTPTTLGALSSLGLPACVPSTDSGLRLSVHTLYPNLTTADCSLSECVTWLKEERCSLLVHDKLNAQYLAKTDKELAMVAGLTNRNYIGLPMNPSLDRDKGRAFNRWLTTAVEDGAFMASLEQQYFGDDFACQGLSGLSEGMLKNYHLDIIVVVDLPFVAYDFSNTGNERFSGYIIDMIVAAQEYLQVSQRLSLQV